MIDVVTPFGDRDNIIEDLRRTSLNGVAITALLGQPDGGVMMRDYPAIAVE